MLFYQPNLNITNNIKKITLYFIRNFINFFKIILGKNIENFYIPNLGIKNVIMIDPCKVEYFNSVPMKFYGNTKFILDFDWDKTNKLIKENEKDHQVYGSCKEIFIDGIPIEKSKMYFYLKKNIEQFKESKGFKTQEDIINFLENKVKLYENIKIKGVQKYINNNIEFMIDRNFNLVKINSGNHRFAISRVLKLRKIPVEIKLISKDCFEDKFTAVTEINKIIKRIENKYT